MDRKRAAKQKATPYFFVFTRSWTQAEVRALKLQILAGRYLVDSILTDGIRAKSINQWYLAAA